MKKFLLIIFLFLSCVNVFASERSFAGSEYIENIYYLKNDGGTIQYRRSQVIRDTVTGEIAYCIEPFKLMVDNSYYDESTYYDSIYGISESKWERIKLYSYYGYGYKSHTDKKWINITQMAIWRTLFPNYQFEWINNLTDKTIIYPFEDEINQLHYLVNSHYMTPNLDSNYVLGIGESIKLKDSNNVIDQFVIKSSDFEASIKGYELEIKAGNTAKEGKIVLERAGEKFPETVKYFYSTESQNVMERGNVTPIKYELNIKVVEGKIIVNKVDSETKDTTPQGEGKLNGSIFELLNENKEVIDELTIENNTLMFDNLPLGKYFIREKSAGAGYYLNQKLYEVIIDNDNLEHEIEIDNEVIKSKVRIIKFYGTKDDYENNRMKREKNVGFIIKDSLGNTVYSGVTNEDGEIELSLPFGNYVIEQTSTTEGYYKIDNYEFSINEENSISYDIVLNDFKINVPNAYISFINQVIDMIKEIVYA